MSTPAGWEGILDTGEEILWQGRPDGKVAFRAGHIFTIIFGFFFAGFALIWMVMAAAGGSMMWMFGLIHFTAGIGVMIGPIFYPAWARRHTWYTLTSKRAFIATDLPLMGRQLKSYPIEASTMVDYRQGSPATVYFATEYRQNKNGSRQVPVGFERIADGEHVYRLIRGLQSRDG